jgi:hypothetical protein
LFSATGGFSKGGTPPGQPVWISSVEIPGPRHVPLDRFADHSASNEQLEFAAKEVPVGHGPSHAKSNVSSRWRYPLAEAPEDPFEALSPGGLAADSPRLTGGSPCAV